jgi:hypothetical protein
LCFAHHGPGYLALSKAAKKWTQREGEREKSEKTDHFKGAKKPKDKMHRPPGKADRDIDALKGHPSGIEGSTSRHGRDDGSQKDNESHATENGRDG